MYLAPFTHPTFLGLNGDERRYQTAGISQALIGYVRLVNGSRSVPYERANPISLTTFVISNPGATGVLENCPV